MRARATLTQSFIASLCAHGAALYGLVGLDATELSSHRNDHSSPERVIVVSLERESIRSSGPVSTPPDPSPALKSEERTPSAPIEATQSSAKPLQKVTRQATTQRTVRSSAPAARTVTPASPAPIVPDSAASNSVPKEGRDFEREGAVVDARLVGITPNYPRFARQNGQEGRVIYKVYVGPNGQVGRIELQKTSGFPLLDEAALNALSEAKFELHTRALAGFVLVGFTFRLSESR